MDKKERDTTDIEFAEQKIIPIRMEREVKSSFINYAMSVIMSRAIPDVRDGLKPVHRRILYAMYEDHLTYDKPYRKSATTVGNVLGRYHPHGDAAVYDSMVRMAQSFSLRYPLIDGQGNFGNIDGDQAAAYRYTEARMSKLADEMLMDIEKKVVDFTPNFDNKLEEPVVLPAGFPNLLVNGCVGIAVGMATNIPTHNLGEVIDGTVYLMDNPDATVSELMNYVKGPDFPTAATICGTAGIYEAYTTGKGRITVRSKAEVDDKNHRIIVTEIPYMVNKVTMVEQMADCHKDKKIEGITAIRDESGKDGLRVVIEYRRDANGEVILNQLYKYTQLQDTCAVNMLALVNNVPKVLGLKEILGNYIRHREEVTVKVLKFELDKAIREAHIFEGYKIAIDNIDAVIDIIRSSESIPDAKLKLCDTFSLSEAQAQAIVEMTLGRLSGMERQKVEDRLARLYATIAELREKLGDENKIKEIIKNELLEIKRKFADERRTEIVEMENEILIEDLIERHTCVITMTNSGYIKRMAANEYSVQGRGGKGVKGITTKEEDFATHVMAVNSHSHLMMFTNKGKVQIQKAYRIPEASRTAKGTNVVNVLEMSDGEKITAMLAVQGFKDGEYLLMVTKNGVVKRTELKEFEYRRKGGKIALKLDEGDELVYVCHTDGNKHIIIATHNGNAVRFEENDARVMGRTARGVRGIRLSEDDYVVGVTMVEDGKSLLTVTENGYGKRSPFSDFNAHSRGGKGVTVQNINEKTGKLAAVSTVNEKDDIVVITDDGITIRVHVSDISEYSRTASGVRIMKLSEGARIVNFANVGNEDEEPKAPEDDGEDIDDDVEGGVDVDNAENTEDAVNDREESVAEDEENSESDTETEETDTDTE
ncbi:MAG: DNA gyrase subunit A [Clostridia bacterium]|nr:DNA gyrase subunit A [Clostridia bacterium]